MGNGKTRSVFILMIFIVLFISWHFLFKGNVFLLVFGTSLFLIAIGGLSFYWLYKAYRQTLSQQRYFWLLLSIGVLIYIAAQLIWLYDQVAEGMPLMSYMALPLFASAYFIFLLALFYRSRIASASITNGSYFFNLIVFVATAAALLTHFFIQPIYVIVDSSLAMTIIILAFPILDISLLFGTLYLIYSSENRHEKRWLFLLFCGFLLQITADSVYAYQVLFASYLPGSSVDFIWTAAIAMIGLSGYYAQQAQEQEIETKTSFHIVERFFPYINALILLIVGTISFKDELNALSIGIAVVFLFIIGRQLFILHKNDRLMAQYKELALYDPLTGLHNRASFQVDLEELLQCAKKDNQRFALLLLDLDRFKVINDTFGHQTGDQMLKLATEKLKRILTKGGQLYRIGGDEFVILLPQASRAESSFTANRILSKFRHSFIIDNHEVTMTPSIGISLYPESGDDSQTLFKNADRAMYVVKERGKNHFEFFNRELAAKLARKMGLENDLRLAIEHNELEIHYQPKIELNTGKVIGMEALLRWNHSELGMISPGEFIPIAEETGQIISIGEWVLKAACQQTKAWQQTGFPKLTVSVNVSAYQFQYSDIVTTVKKVLQETGLIACDLELEITESLMQNVQESTGILRRLKELGVQTAIDDFGTGYSSLHILKKLPVDTIKIDKSFIDDMTDYMNESMVKTIIDIGKNLNLKVVAEGIEFEEQVASLAKYNCDIGQGYYFSKPAPSSEIEKLLRTKVSPITQKSMKRLEVKCPSG
ncbi:DUF4084 domain-containing protein [Bacillus sp. B15-48]|uniref:putative bifunctional diguanylate cyclase/phosphodiesterase n=1 Tax=Bacillus sp. B15-48 TaxID=1548601 RepID=UPI00193ECFE9|nr:DUF4084 domain-containing protein [Bacillus sp. B15-48]MBM4760977.1 EAL domain-containing protein [Bacillus sp. B15-48]